MKKNTEQTEVFYADDGTKFITETECVAYEKAEQAKSERLKHIKFFSAIHSPDLTEGRGWYGRLFMAVEDSYAVGDQETYALSAMVTLYGNPLGFVQGTAAMPNWRISPSSLSEFQEWKTKEIRVGDYGYPASALFISSKGGIDGWPNPVAVSDLLDKNKVKSHIAGGRK